MLFNSYEYAIFLPLVFLLYWFVFNKSVKIQNAFLLLTGYVFYGWWDWRFLFLIAFSSVLDYFLGISIHRANNSKKRKWLFAASCFINLGILGVFKYYNFFIDNLIGLFGQFGYHLPAFPLNIILPVGISFYTFQSLSYTADIYFRKIKPANDVVLFAAYISFFPQLVAGPIERAGNMLPQFNRVREFNTHEAGKGMREMLWGFFKKIVIADSLAIYVNDIFGSYQDLPGSTLFLGAVYFAVQIYCDFSGYSSIARGTARLFGFSLMNNFYFPYFSKSVSEFWRRWHISLSTWFRDYVYIPLGGNRGTRARTVINIMGVFSLSGLWHGANWTFIFWGLLNGLFILPAVFAVQKQKVSERIKLFPALIDLLKISTTFLLITFSWIFFRSESLSAAAEYIQGMFSASFFSYPVRHGMALTVPLILLLVIAEWLLMNRQKLFPSFMVPSYARWSVYLIMAIICLSFFRHNQSFIYFQF